MKVLVTGGSGFIGTNLIEKLSASAKHSLLNLDANEPKDSNHLKYWRQCDILDASHVNKLFTDFKPEVVVHLAARTDTDPKNTMDDYVINIKGTENIINAIKLNPEVSKAVFTSTQFVHQYHGLPKHDEDYAPHTIYGESKMAMEQIIRRSDLACAWTIIRPTNIWGPWHLRYPYEFWKILSKGLYIHPGREPVIRSYGYVGNVVAQIIAIVNSPKERVTAKVFYVGDSSIDLYDWVNGFSLQQRGETVRVVPRILVKILAWVGDTLSYVNIGFPITSSRYKSMTHSNIAPMEKTLEAFGQPPYTMEEGIAETVAWMKQYFPHLVKRDMRGRK